jgi:hypothetical protein
MVRRSLTEVDFVEGILTVAALRHHRTFAVNGTRFDQAMAAAYRSLLDDPALPADLEVEFQIRPHPIHGDSPVVRGAVNAAVGDRRARRVNPTFKMVEATTLIVEPDSSEQFLARLPGGSDLYEKLADRFLAAYYGPETGAETAEK